MSKHIDRTLRDLGRRNLNFRKYEVVDAMPNYIVENYPKFVELLQSYYKFENEDVSPSRLIDQLFETRDITQADLKLLSFIEDEYLLGQSYFEGFDDKRDAAKYSNFLYRSKGTKYSISQFFKAFFGIDPDILYTKEQVFTLNDSKIGPESQRYLTDDKLYQKYAILIRSELSISKWRDAYKLFVHPAGMYLGAQLQIVGVASLDALQFDPGRQLPQPNEIEGAAYFDFKSYANHSALFDFGVRNLNGPDVISARTYDENGDPVLKFRTSLGSPSTSPDQAGNELRDYENLTIENIDGIYSSMAELLTINSPTLDDDDYIQSDFDDTRDEFDIVRSGSGFDLSSGERIDQEVWEHNMNIQRLDSDNNLFQGLVGDSDDDISLREIIDNDI